MNKRTRRLQVAGCTLCALATVSSASAFAQDADLVDAPEATGEQVANEQTKTGLETRPAQQVVEPSGVSVAIGPLVASRAMQLRVDANSISHEPDLYMGATARFGVEIADFDGSDAVLFLQGEGGYGASRNSMVADELRRQPVTEWSFLSARLTVRRDLSDAVALDVGFGAYANSFIIEPNLTYTGHRYIAADIHAGLRLEKPSSNWSSAVDLSAYPVLSVDQSGDAHGQSSAFGARAGAQVGYNVTELESSGGFAGARVMLRYDYTRFRSQFPEGRIALDDGFSEDDIHSLTLLLGYYL